MTYTKRCTRCYVGEPQVTFTGDNSRCDTCMWEVENVSLPSASSRANCYDEVMDREPRGDPIEYVARVRGGLDIAIITQLTEQQRMICEWMMNESGACPHESPDDMAVRLLGDPDTHEDRVGHNRLVTSYLSASMDAATWLGYYIPRARRKAKGWD